MLLGSKNRNNRREKEERTLEHFPYNSSSRKKKLELVGYLCNVIGVFSFS